MQDFAENRAENFAEIIVETAITRNYIIINVMATNYIDD